MNIKINEGVGPIKFGMPLSQVVEIMGDKQTIEDWMGGNRNDSLMYPGIIIGFNQYDSNGPTPDGIVFEFEIEKSFPNLQFLGVDFSLVTQKELETLLNKDQIPFFQSASNIFNINNCLEIHFNNQNQFEILYFWKSSDLVDTPKPINVMTTDELITFLEMSEVGWPQFFRRLEAIERLEKIGDLKCLNILRSIEKKDIEEFDAWGLDVSFSLSYFAQKTIKRLDPNSTSNYEIVSFFMSFFKGVDYKVGLIRAEFAKFDYPKEGDWLRAKKIIKYRQLEDREPIRLVVEIAGQLSDSISDETAYSWLEQMIKDLDPKM